MKFQSKEHETRFKTCLNAIGDKAKYSDYQALMYLLTLDDTAEHIKSLFDFEELSIIPESINAGWQTGSTIRTTSLAFSLFTGGNNWIYALKNPEGYSDKSNICYIFGYSELDNYYIQALQIAYFNTITE